MHGRHQKKIYNAAKTSKALTLQQPDPANTFTQRTSHTSEVLQVLIKTPTWLQGPASATAMPMVGHAESMALDREVRAFPLHRAVSSPCSHPKGCAGEECRITFLTEKEGSASPFLGHPPLGFTSALAEKSFSLQEMLPGTLICKQPFDSEKTSCPISRMLSYPLGTHKVHLHDTRPRHTETSTLVPTAPAQHRCASMTPCHSS